MFFINELVIELCGCCYYYFQLDIIQREIGVLFMRYYFSCGNLNLGIYNWHGKIFTITNSE